MNITVENLAPCKKLLRVELDAKSVDEIFDAITKDYQKQAALPGFRPGKAPRDMVVKKYERGHQGRGQAQAHRRELPQGARGEKNLTSSAIRTSRKSSSAAAKICSSPRRSRPRRNFNCRNTRACPPSAKTKSVTDEDVERALNLLAQQHAKFETVARELKMGDVAVVNYTGTCDGKPITETRADGERSDGTEKFLGGYRAERVHRRFCRTAHRREGGRQAHGERGFPRRFRDEGTCRAKKAFLKSRSSR